MDQPHQRARTVRNTSNNPDSRYGQSSQQQAINPPHNQQLQGQANIAATTSISYQDYPPPGVPHGRGSQEDTTGAARYLQAGTTSDCNTAGLRPQPPTLLPVSIPPANFSQAGSSGAQPQPVVTAGSTAPPFNSPAQFQATHTISGFNNPGAITGGTQRHFPQGPADNPGVPQCKLPGCRQPRFFDNRVQEQLDYCRHHVYTAISDGFAALCERCKELPALHDSKYCSRACSSNADTRGQSVVRQPSVGAVPQGFAATCQECRRPMGDSNRRFCSLQCENASRGHLSHR